MISSNNTNITKYNNNDPRIGQFINYAYTYMTVEQIEEIIIKLNQIKNSKEKINKFLYSACNYTNF